MTRRLYLVLTPSKEPRIDKIRKFVVWEWRWQWEVSWGFGLDWDRKQKMVRNNGTLERQLQSLKFASTGFSGGHSVRPAVAHHLFKNVKPLTCRPNSVVHLSIGDLLLTKSSDEITLVCWAGAGASAASVGFGGTMVKYWECHSIHTHSVLQPIPKLAFLAAPHFFIRGETLGKAESGEANIMAEPGRSRWASEECHIEQDSHKQDSNVPAP